MAFDVRSIGPVEQWPYHIVGETEGNDTGRLCVGGSVQPGVQENRWRTTRGLASTKKQRGLGRGRAGGATRRLIPSRDAVRRSETSGKHRHECCGESNRLSWCSRDGAARARCPTPY